MEQKESLITNAGKGLFATRDWTKGEIITQLSKPREILLKYLDTIPVDSAIQIIVKKKRSSKSCLDDR
jgi:hypothetical protein